MSYSIDSASELQASYTRNRFRHELAEQPFCAAGPVCQNCDRVVDRVTLVPEFNYMGCDDCMDEALHVLAAEAKAILKKSAQIERIQGELFPGKEVA
jgi:hypothetical protein